MGEYIEYIVRKEDTIKVFHHEELIAEFHDDFSYEIFVKGVKEHGDIDIWIPAKARYENLD